MLQQMFIDSQDQPDDQQEHQNHNIHSHCFEYSWTQLSSGKGHGHYWSFLTKIIVVIYLIITSGVLQ